MASSLMQLYGALSASNSELFVPTGLMWFIVIASSGMVTLCFLSFCSRSKCSRCSPASEEFLMRNWDRRLLVLSIRRPLLITLMGRHDTVYGLANLRTRLYPTVETDTSTGTGRKPPVLDVRSYFQRKEERKQPRTGRKPRPATT